MSFLQEDGYCTQGLLQLDNSFVEDLHLKLVHEKVIEIKSINNEAKTQNLFEEHSSIEFTAPNIFEEDSNIQPKPHNFFEEYSNSFEPRAPNIFGENSNYELKAPNVFEENSNFEPNTQNFFEEDSQNSEIFDFRQQIGKSIF